MERKVDNRDCLLIVEKICSRFPKVARQLGSRQRNKKPFEIMDEYDVQYLLHALLLLEFDDIRPEEWTPSYAGGSSRVDFLLKNEKIIIEVKKTRPNLKDKEVGEQLIIDIEGYQTYQDFKKLICFVYDPDHLIKNPSALENDLRKDKDDFMVKVIIAPKL
ncbi:PD-(D/E)XK nuclease domain-containing protein [Pseudocalidococcus azoricus]|uniref:PD-(D/E)XK nuclease domain-containing protein n=1 Tax=Pseudocalidococcus azoricus TaxID=3110322 RepID=UPI00389AFE10